MSTQYLDVDLYGGFGMKPHPNIDKLWGPYASPEDAYSRRTAFGNTENRVAGLKFGVINNGVVEEYMIIGTGDYNSTPAPYKKLVLSEDDVAGAFVIDTTDGDFSALESAIEAGKIIIREDGDSKYLVSISATTNLNEYLLSYVDSSGMLHKIIANSSSYTETTESLVNYFDFTFDSSNSANTTTPADLKEAVDAGKLIRVNGYVATKAECFNNAGTTFVNIYYYDDEGKQHHIYKNATTQLGYREDIGGALSDAVTTEASSNTFSINNSDGDPVGTITLSTAASGAAVLTFADNVNGSFTATLPNLIYDSSNQMLKMVEVDGTQTNLIKLSNLQIKGVGSTLPCWDTTATPDPVSREAKDATGAPHWAIGDLFLLENSSTTPSTFDLCVCTNVVDDGTYYNYSWQSLGSINNVSLQAEHINFTSESGLQSTDVQHALDEVNRTSESVDERTKKIEDVHRVYVTETLLDATIDADNKILDAIGSDGTEQHYTRHVFNGGILAPELDAKANVGDLEDKVDKVEGKDLISTKIISSFAIDNSDLLDATIDADRRILDAIKSDGIEEHYTEHNFRGGLKAPELDEKVDKVEGKTLIDESVADINKIEDRDDYLLVTIDSNRKILEATKKDGTKYFPGNVEIEGNVICENINTGGKYFDNLKLSPLSNVIHAHFYLGEENRQTSDYIVNAISYPNGVIIAARSAVISTVNGKIVRINLDGTETELLSIAGASDWRLLWMDSNMNVYVSPHDSNSRGLNNSDRGLYKLSYGGNSFSKVLDLSSTGHKDTIWTMCEDASGNLYAGLYSHTSPFTNPYIYKSTNGGDTWSVVSDLKDIISNGSHIHCIIYNQYNDALYTIVGEVNTILKSIDKGVTWQNLNTPLEGDKGTSMLAVPDGIIIGSDGAYSLTMSKLMSDDKTTKTCGRVWANTCFGLRRSDITGWIYSFGKIDSSVNSTSYMPPVEAITDASALQTWENSSPSNLSKWEAYHDTVSPIYTNDSIRPQHYAILVSKDNGETWEVAYRETVPTNAANGIWTVGQFRNGECVCGRFISNGSSTTVLASRPLIISEGKHNYSTNGINIDNDIFSKIKN